MVFMSTLPLLLVLSSTFLHATWNLLARRQRAEEAFFGRMLIAVLIPGFLPAALSEWLAPALSLRVWAYLAVSGTFCGFYYFFLARGYRDADFTVVYPLARALPVLLVGIGDVVRGRYPTPLGWMGMVLVVAGCFLVPLRSLREIAVSRYLNRASLWMTLTALCTVGYSLIDKMAAKLVPPGPASAARYEYAFYLISWLAYTGIVRLWGDAEGKGDTIGWRLPLLAGSFNFIAYWLVLWAYQLSERASYIVAFRQFSIVIGVVLAFLIYQEEGRAVRLTATLLITGGLLIIGIGGR